MNNMLKEFEELLLNNTLFKVQNQALGDKNPKWKEWWQIVQEFIKEFMTICSWLIVMNKVINSSYKLTILLSLISNTNPQVSCLWKSELVVEF
jgi:hypothetical protein